MTAEATGAEIRDFIYLDWERIRSYVAQLDRGVPETITGTLTSDEGDQAGGEFGFPGFAKMEKHQDLRYIRSASETRSLHHAVFARFESRLVAGGSLVELDSGYGEADWSEHRFETAQFCRVVGTTRLVDYASILDLLEKLIEMMKLGHAGENSALKSRGLPQAEYQRQAQALDRQHREQLKEVNGLGLGQIASGIRSLYGDSVRVKVVPDIARPGNLFVGTAQRDCFDESVLRSIGTRGAATNSTWTALLQVESLSQSAEVTGLPTGNQIEDSLDGLVAHMDGLTSLLSGTEWPVVSCIPLAIYRKVRAGMENAS